MIKVFKKYSYPVVLLFMSVMMSACVESLSDSTSSTSATPTIVIYSPASNDSIKVGTTNVNYAAYDGSGGQGLSYFELYLNGTYAQKITVGTDGTNPAISISADSTWIGKKISYYIVVYNKQGKSKTSATQSGIYIRDKSPNAPSNLIAGFTNSNTVTLLWDDNSSNEKGFELWRKDINSTGVVEYRVVKTLLENTRSTIDFVSSSGAYYYKVRAFNYTDKNKLSTYLYSDFSNEADPYSSSGGSWNLRAESITDPSVHLYWNDFISSEQGFIIERTPSFSSGSSTMLIAPNTTDYLDKDVSTNTTYSYRVAFFTTTFKSPFSNSTSVSTYYTTVAAPTLLSFNTPLNTTQSGFYMQWKEQSKETMQGTIIQRTQLLPFVDWQDVDNMPLSDIKVDTYGDTKVTVGRAYQYRIRQYSTSGSSVFYTPWVITPATTAK